MSDQIVVRSRDRQQPVYRTLFIVAMLGGIALAAYIYGVLFDALSEEELVQTSALWVLPVVFGLYGLMAEKLQYLVEKGDELSITRAALIWVSALPLIGIVLLLPLLFARGHNALVIAFLATLVWAMLLVVFFVVIFPLL